MALLKFILLDRGESCHIHTTVFVFIKMLKEEVGMGKLFYLLVKSRKIQKSEYICIFMRTCTYVHMYFERHTESFLAHFERHFASFCAPFSVSFWFHSTFLSLFKKYFFFYPLAESYSTLVNIQFFTHYIIDIMFRQKGENSTLRQTSNNKVTPPLNPLLPPSTIISCILHPASFLPGLFIFAPYIHNPYFLNPFSHRSPSIILSSISHPPFFILHHWLFPLSSFISASFHDPYLWFPSFLTLTYVLPHPMSNLHPRSLPPSSSPSSFPIHHCGHLGGI